jgi:hypothetical protein
MTDYIDQPIGRQSNSLNKRNHDLPIKLPTDIIEVD